MEWGEDKQKLIHTEIGNENDLQLSKYMFKAYWLLIADGVHSA